MRIAYIGKFSNLHDEEYIACAFEMLGMEVRRIGQYMQWRDIQEALIAFKPDILIYAKWDCPKELDPTIRSLKRNGMKTVCWLFDLYFGYSREYQIRTRLFFRSDYVFTTDGGHNSRFANVGIKHFCVRQGIHIEECVLLPFKEPEHEVIFIGSDNPLFLARTKVIREIEKDFDFTWFGRKNTNEKRGMDLNELYSKTKIVIGDSVYSPLYWSNRIVETLGRGGFLIHQEVEGLKKEYPDLVTYKRGDIQDLRDKIKYYLEHEEERRAIVKKNYELVRNKYTMDKKCRILLDYVEAY